MGIPMNYQCVRCLVNKHLDTAKDLGAPQQVDGFCKELLPVLQAAVGKHNSSWVAPYADALYSKYFGTSQDRFIEEKKQSSRIGI